MGRINTMAFKQIYICTPRNKIGYGCIKSNDDGQLVECVGESPVKNVAVGIFSAWRRLEVNMTSFFKYLKTQGKKQSER